MASKPVPITLKNIKEKTYSMFDRVTFVIQYCGFGEFKLGYTIGMSSLICTIYKNNKYEKLRFTDSEKARQAVFKQYPDSFICFSEELHGE